MKSPVTWCKDNHLKLRINRTTKFVVGHHAPNMDNAEMKTLKHKDFILHLFSSATKRIYAVSITV